MQINTLFIKKGFLSLLFILVFANSAFAIPKDPCEPKREPVCCEEPKPGPFAFSFPKDMNLSCPSDFYFRADLLIMQAKEEGLEYAIRNTDNTSLIYAGETMGFSTEHHDWSWDLGLRVGMGFYLNHDAWNIDLQYTWFQVSQEVSESVQNNGVFIPLWLPNDGGGELSGNNTRSSARWELSLNVFDFSFGKPFHISRYLVWQPFFGLRAAWIDQDYVARYSGAFYGDLDIDGVKMRAQNDYWGVGTRIGFNSDWNVGAGWNLVANWNISMLHGKFDVDQDAAIIDQSFALEHEFYQNEPNMEIQVGISWGCYFNKHQHHVALQAMYELHQWWDQNWMRKLYTTGDIVANDTVSRGDLSLNGISIRLLFDF